MVDGAGKTGAVKGHRRHVKSGEQQYKLTG